MASYVYRVKIETTDVTDAVIAPFTWTNGRNTLAESLCKTWGSVSLYKAKLEAIYGYTPLSVISFGQDVTLEVYDVGSATWTTAVAGKITDLSSDRDTITATFVDRAIWTITKLESVSLPTGNHDDLTAHIADVVDAYIAVTDATTGGPYKVHWTITSTTNLGDWASTMIGDIPSGLGYFSDGLILADRADVPTPALTLTDGAIFDNFSIARGINDICNSVRIEYHSGGVYSETNATSVAAIGTRHQDVTSYLREAADAETLARTFLGRFAPDGWPVVAFRTSAEMIGKSGKWVAQNAFPNLVIDASTVGTIPFASTMYLEQVTHRLGPNLWALDLVVSDSRYSNLPQQWNQVTATKKWSDVSATLTWGDMIYQEL